MSRLLRGVFCVIEIFHKYASEDGGKATLTRRELRHLLEGEIGNFLQPHIFHSVERKLNLLDTEEDVVISLEEYLLALFSFVHLFYSDISSLNPEPRLMSQSEKMDDVEFRAVGVGPTRERLLIASEVISSAQSSHKEDEVGEDWEDVQTHSLPTEVSEPNDSENQHSEEDGQEVTQDTPATEYDGVELKRNKPVEVSKQYSNPTQVIPRDGGKAVSRQHDTKLRDHMAQRPSGEEEHATKKSIKKHSTTQDPFPQKEDRDTPKHTETAAGKPSQTQKGMELMDDTRVSKTQEPEKDAGRTPPETINLENLKADRTSETHELPLQERKYQTQNQSTQSRSRKDSETSGRSKQEEGRKEQERKTGSPAPDAQTQHEKHQEFSGLQENGTGKGSGMPGLSSEERNQNLPEIKEDSISGQEARHSEEDTADAFLIKKTNPTAEEALGIRESAQELASLETQSQGKSPQKEDQRERQDPESAVTQRDQGSCETSSSLALEAETDSGESQVARDLQTQADTSGGSKQGSDNSKPDPEKQGVLSIPEDRQHSEEQEQLSRAKLEGLGPAVEPSEGGKIQDSTATENRKSPEAESSGAQ